MYDRAYLHGPPRYLVQFPDTSVFYWTVRPDYAKCGITNTELTLAHNAAVRLETAVKGLLSHRRVHTSTERFIQTTDIDRALVERLIIEFASAETGIFISRVVEDQQAVEATNVPDGKVRLCETEFETFFKFVYARESAWYRREVLGSVDWTSEPVLRERRMTNTRRELDVGTRVLWDALDRHRDRSYRERLFNVLLYRYLGGSYWIWRDVIGGWVYNRSDVQDVLLRLFAYQDTIFGRAGQAKAGTTARVSATTLLERSTSSWLDRLETLHEAASRATSLREPYVVLTNPQDFGGFGKFGNFSALNVATDLPVLYTNLHDDEWVYLRSNDNVGPADRGPAVSLLRMFGENMRVRVSSLARNQDVLLDMLRRLRNEQEKHFDQLNLPWSTVAWTVKPQLTLVDLEHTLCEFNKWERFSRTGRGLRRLDRGPHGMHLVSLDRINEIVLRMRSERGEAF